jgi:hydrogenase expression/formation protein HypD
VDEYRDPAVAHSLAAEIRSLVTPGDTVRVMEICGGHTHAIYRHGLEELLPPELELVHGPGCPVCVIPMGRVDDAIAIAETDGVTLATFGDMMRVPGGRGSLLEAKARGADVRMVYSPLDALALARQEPDRHVCFFAIGFETTAPATAVTLLRARTEGVPNFSVFCNHVLIEPPLRAILETPGLRIDAFVGPGHVSSVIGTDAYRFIPEEYGRAVVVSAFEPVDLLQSIAMLLRQRVEGRCEVENQTPGSSGARGTSGRSRPSPRRWSRARTSSGAASACCRGAPSRCARRSPHSTRSASSPCRAHASRIPRPAAAVRC